eukprot:10772937-Alexandrium_andersonii.AAC.1
MQHAISSLPVIPLSPLDILVRKPWLHYPRELVFPFAARVLASLALPVQTCAAAAQFVGRQAVPLGCNDIAPASGPWPL